MVAAGGSQIYSLRSDKPAKVDTFEFPNLIWQKSLSLESFINPQAYGRDIDDFGEGKILVVENEKQRRSDPDSYTVFVVDLQTSRLRPKIRTGREGQGTLLPKSDRIVFDEKKEEFNPVTRVPYSAGTGNLQIFDAVTGNRLGTINIPAVQNGRVLGVSATEDLLYYQSHGPLGANPRLWIISLRTFSVTAQVPLPFPASRMFIFDE